MPLLRRLAAATGGVSAIEFALVAAFLILPLTIGVYDFGTALYRWMEVGNAARAGAQYINVNGFSTTYTTSGQTCPATPTNTFTCAVSTATSLGTNILVKVSGSSPYCGCQSGTTYNAKVFAPPCNTCNATYTSNCCPAGQTPVTMADVSAKYTYTPIFSYLGFGPSSGFDLTATSTALLY